ncbi:MAG: cytochrome c-type biogenesis protein CcmH [Lautropia sp.]|nr:cytochrome c-type biogenesis protein CcmH [Lautropia sp.]
MKPRIPQSRLIFTRPGLNLLLSASLLLGGGALSPDSARASGASWASGASAVSGAAGDTAILIFADAAATTAGTASMPSATTASTSTDRPAPPATSAAGDGSAGTRSGLPGLPTDDDGLPADADSIVRTPRFRQLAHELRCLVCQNQTLLDSHAPLAQDLRNEVIRLMATGRDDEQIKQYLVDRYGEFVLYRPSWSWQNALLWLGPALMLMGALVVGWRFARRGRTGLSPAAPGKTASRGKGTADTAHEESVREGAPVSPAGSPATAAARADAATGHAGTAAANGHAALAEVDALLADENATPTPDRQPGGHSG